MSYFDRRGKRKNMKSLLTDFSLVWKLQNNIYHSTKYDCSYRYYCKTVGEEIGRGNFGIVYKGRLRGRSSRMNVVSSSEEMAEVAIKTHISKVGVTEFKALLSEVKILAHVGKHPHVVSFIGACTENIRKREYI